MFRCLLICSIFYGLLSAPQLWADDGRQNASGGSPVGRWKTIDDVTGEAKSIVKIWEEHGKLYGMIQRLVNPDPQDPNPHCDDCTGSQKGKPVIGLQILWGLQKDGDAWSGGTILDPASGKTYKCELKVENGGTKLKVRGFLGLSLLGRTQYWLRE